MLVCIPYMDPMGSEKMSERCLSLDPRYGPKGMFSSLWVSVKGGPLRAADLRFSPMSGIASWIVQPPETQGN